MPFPNTPGIVTILKEMNATAYGTDTIIRSSPCLQPIGSLDSVLDLCVCNTCIIYVYTCIHMDNGMSTVRL